jgi:hypothetical protein
VAAYENALANPFPQDKIVIGDSDGGTFKNQGDCIQFVNTGK